MSQNVFPIDSARVSFPGAPVPAPAPDDMYAPLATMKYSVQGDGKLTVYVRVIVFQDSNSNQVPTIPSEVSPTTDSHGNVEFSVEIDYDVQSLGQTENYKAYYLEQKYTNITNPGIENEVKVTFGQSKTDPTKTSRGTVVVVRPSSGDID